MRWLISFVSSLFIWLVILIVASSIAIAMVVRSPELTRKVIQFSANQVTRPYLSDSVLIGKAHFDSHFAIHIENLSASIQSSQGPVRFNVKKLDSESSVIQLVKPGGCKFKFNGATFAGSKHPGVNGSVKLKGMRGWFVDVTADVGGIGFEELTWINPDHLHGTTGNLLGTLEFHAKESEGPSFKAELEVKTPGGVMQTQLIRFLFQYLPPMSVKPEVKRMVEERGLVRYVNAKINAEMAASDQVKVVLFIAVPDYNFNLNTNVEIHIDAKNALGQITQILGLIKAGHS